MSSTSRFFAVRGSCEHVVEIFRNRRRSVEPQELLRHIGDRFGDPRAD
jgi:hypothetical protein